MMVERSANRQLAINMISSFVAFAANLGINFFLTPFIVKQLGIEAYGFLGLSSNIIGYTSIITIALNSMAGRFITIKYQEGNVKEANQYFSSVFFSNIILSGVIILTLLVFLFNLESIFEIPHHLVLDVKALFSFSILTTIVSLLTNVYGVATFIKNRLDLSSIRQIFGNILRTALIVIFFGCFPAHLWYYGLTGVVIAVYTSITDIHFSRSLTPELRLNIVNYDWKKVKELLSSGVWNLVNKLGEILAQGLDLLIANICIGVAEMGMFAITKNVPFLILSLFQMIAGVFAPLLTILYAKKDYDNLHNELFKSIRILSLFTALPLVLLYVYGDSFYSLWLPTENASELQKLTILGTFALPYTLPLESLWNIFTITNKLKYSSLFMLGNNVFVFLVVLSSMLIVDSHEIRLLILASTRSICGLVRGFVFLPMYGAYCLNLNKYFFYPTIFKAIFCITICIGLSFVLRFIYIPNNWIGLFGASLIVAGICIGVCSILLLKQSDRFFIYRRILHRK